MNTLWKYAMPQSPGRLIMPIGAKVLDVQLQGGQFMLWALVDADEDRTSLRTYVLYGTGERVPENPGRYLATVQYGSEVWHAFELMDR